jgi:nucleotide-binding universal stress UspA family protein
MNEGPALICYDGSDGAQRAIESAALLGPRRAVVLDVGSVLTAAESYAAFSPMLPGEAFEELNEDDALRHARAGAERARLAGFDAEARGEVDAPLWQGIVDVADEIDAAVIIIGSRGLTGVRELADSLARQVVEHATRPVLVVPPPTEH